MSTPANQVRQSKPRPTERREQTDVLNELGMKSTQATVVKLTPADGVDLHPAIIELTRPHLDDMIKSVAKIGQTTPVHVFVDSDGDRHVIFGGTRWLACEANNVPCECILTTSTGAFDTVEELIAEEYSISLKARGLNDIQRAFDAARIARDVYEPRALKRKQHKAGGKGEPATSEEKGRSCQLAAEKYKVAENAVKKAKSLLGTPVEELVSQGRLTKMSHAIKLHKIHKTQPKVFENAQQALNQDKLDEFLNIVDPTPELTDSNGIRVPSKLVPIFSERKREILDAAKALETTALWVDQEIAKDTENGASIKRVDIPKLREMAIAIRGLAAREVCRSCRFAKGKCESCTVCQGAGYLTNYAVDRLIQQALDSKNRPAS